MTGKITLAMLAFAANSVLCRVALKGVHIDPLSFSSLRLVGGAVVLFILLLKPFLNRKIEWYGKNAFFLGVYVLAFSAAYVHLGAAEGALLLFGTVQLVMTGWGTYRGEKLTWIKMQWHYACRRGDRLPFTARSKQPGHPSCCGDGAFWPCLGGLLHRWEKH
jgi:hypothetical protein